MHFTIDEDSLDDFLDFGLISPDRTLLVPETRNYTIQNTFRFFEINPGEGSPSSVLQAMERAVDEVVSSGEVDSLAFSGGADSRLIISILLKNHRETLDHLFVYTRIHPRLGAENDRDFLITSFLGKKFGFKVNAIESDFHTTDYLSPNSGTKLKSLSGLWGTELLGGQIFHQFPTTRARLTQAEAESSPLSCFVDSTMGDHDEKSMTTMCFFLNLLLNSTTTSFYSSPSWLWPGRASRFSVTPFLTDTFLNEILKFEQSELENYRLYHEVLNLISPELMEVDINNPFFSERTFRYGPGGVDPKEVSGFLSSHGSTNSPVNMVLKEVLGNRTDSERKQYLLFLLDRIDFSKVYRDLFST